MRMASSILEVTKSSNERERTPSLHSDASLICEEEHNNLFDEIKNSRQHFDTEANEKLEAGEACLEGGAIFSSFKAN